MLFQPLFFNLVIYCDVLIQSENFIYNNNNNNNIQTTNYTYNKLYITKAKGLEPRISINQDNDNDNDNDNDSNGYLYSSYPVLY